MICLPWLPRDARSGCESVVVRREGPSHDHALQKRGRAAWIAPRLMLCSDAAAAAGCANEIAVAGYCVTAWGSTCMTESLLVARHAQVLGPPGNALCRPQFGSTSALLTGQVIRALSVCALCCRPSHRKKECDVRDRDMTAQLVSDSRGTDILNRVHLCG